MRQASKKTEKKGKYSVFSSFYSNWRLAQVAQVAQVALTHVNGSYGDMLYMAGWRQQNHELLQPRLSESHHFSSG